MMARADSDGTRWYTSRWKPPLETTPGGDSHALADGWVAISPLGLDQTAEGAFPLLQQFELEVPVVEARCSLNPLWPRQFLARGRRLACARAKVMPPYARATRRVR